MSDRHARLVGLKLRVLVGEHLGGRIEAEPQQFAPGAALRVGHSAWVLLETDPERRLGAALAWAIRNDADELHVIAESGNGTLARRAAEFAFPIQVWSAEERALRPAVAEALAPPVAAQPEHLRLTELIANGGAVPVVEHGVVFGEVRGLEVCRVVDAPGLDTVRLEVGVGAHDREAFQLVHGDVPPAEALAIVVEAVSRHRHPGPPRHPLDRIARERLLRWQLEQSPELVGATHLAHAQPPTPRRRLNDVVACSATGTDGQGRPLLVVCSSGVDLDVVPYAADARLAATAWGDGAPGVAGGEPHVVIAITSRDLVPVTADLAALLRQSVELVPVD